MQDGVRSVDQAALTGRGPSTGLKLEAEMPLSYALEKKTKPGQTCPFVSVLIDVWDYIKVYI